MADDNEDRINLRGDGRVIFYVWLFGPKALK